MTAGSRLSFSPTFLIRSVIDLIQSWSAWAMFKRQMSTPAPISFSNISSLSVAGPMVAIILVCRLIFFTPSEELPFGINYECFKFIFGHSILIFEEPFSHHCNPCSSA